MVLAAVTAANMAKLVMKKVEAILMTATSYYLDGKILAVFRCGVHASRASVQECLHRPEAASQSRELEMPLVLEREGGRVEKGGGTLCMDQSLS